MPGLEGIALGRYRLQHRLGQGGMAEVYLADDERMHREVAIKVVSTSHREFAERFARETEAMGNLHHDHILRAYDYGEQGSWHYLVMPYIEYGTLSERLKDGPLSLEHAGELLRQIASGLQYAHRHGIVHRDIKPSNILLRDEHYIYVADFGLTRMLGGSHDLTATGTLLGTPEYMAPELSEGSAGVSTDTYALAVVLYEMISGWVPFQADTALAIFWKHIREEAPAPSYYNPAIPAAVDRVLLRALEKDPHRRYASPLALAQAYEDALNGLDEMPALYDIPDESPPQPMPIVFEAPSPESARHERLVLPETHVAATPSGFKHPHPPITPAAVRMRTPVIRTPIRVRRNTSDQVMRPLRRQSRSHRASVGVIMGLIFLLLVGALLTYLTTQTGQQNTVASTATARVDATNGALVQQTQQVQATQQAATVGVQSTQQTIQSNMDAITSSMPVLSDPLIGPDENGWPDDGTSCAFTSSSYVATAQGSQTLQPCIAAASSVHYSDAAFQLGVSLLKGNDAGLVFRTSADGSQFYDFEITNQGQFYLRYRNQGTYTYLIQATTSSAILGNGQQNTLLVIAKGADFQLFINGTFVGETHDSTFASGGIGVVVGTLTTTSGSASFTHFNVYRAQ